METDIKLNNWRIVSTLLGPYDAPETAAACLVGEVHGHPHFSNGHLVTTSRLIKADPAAGWAETLNTTYRLGPMESGFEQYLADNGYRLSDYKIGEPHG